jgi:hypothetical protein
VRINFEEFKITMENPKLEYEKFRLQNVFNNNKNVIEEYYDVTEQNLKLFFENFSK